MELGCGNGMLLFRIAPIVAKAAGGRYIGTDISNSGLSLWYRRPLQGDRARKLREELLSMRPGKSPAANLASSEDVPWVPKRCSERHDSAQTRPSLAAFGQCGLDLDPIR